MKVRLLVAVALAAAGSVIPAPASDTMSIYDTLAGLKEHSVLHVAITEGKEVIALKAAGPMTLFAPTDDAFKKLDDATVKKIAGDKPTVRRLIRSHLVEGKYTTKELAGLDGRSLRTLQGGARSVEKVAAGFRVDGVRIVTADILCSNGVIHVIDTVLPLPKE